VISSTGPFRLVTMWFDKGGLLLRLRVDAIGTSFS
jgi:hypothetical protein